MKQRRIVFGNRKGGCGKTSSAVNVAAGLALAGRKTLLVDCDAQCHASISLGFSPYSQMPSLYDVLTNETLKITDVMAPVKWPEKLYIVPSSNQLAAYELEGKRDPKSRNRLANLFMTTDMADIDYIIIDPPPTLGLLFVKSLIAASEVVIPVQTHFLSMESLAEMVRLVYQVNATVNPQLKITGILPTFYSRQIRLAKDVIKEIKKNFGEDMLLPLVRQDFAIAEAPGFGKCIYKHAPVSMGATDYAAVVERLDGNCTVNFPGKNKPVKKKPQLRKINVSRKKKKSQGRIHKKKGLS
ncbi:chromosome partitioning protein ParA [Candidatus Magnetomorum sp. HK-1]|nr:chromosome partitioning protein ParA [Candidatus Magnetomorum sp. HK-1]